MINKILMKEVASYREDTVIETDKKINLIYGLNGSGKSTISDFLYNREDSRFENCLIEGLNDEKICVYNRQFIEDTFYEDDLQGIFTLSKENKEALEKIKKLDENIKKLRLDKEDKEKSRDEHTKKLTEIKNDTKDETWKIKEDYTGGDRVLDYCFKGVKSNKDNLLTRLLETSKPERRPEKTIKELEKEVKPFKDNVAQEYDLLPKTNFSNGIIEKDSIFQKKIVGNEDSAIAGLIKKLNNSDWVKQGIEYIPQEFSNEAEICPFCQQKTITRALANEIRSYFNEEYEKNIDFLKHLLSDYERGIDSLPNKDIYEKNGFLAEEDGNLNKLLNLYNSLKNCLDNNKNKIQEKLQSPSQVIELIDSRKHLDSFNQFVKEINVKINKHNLKVVDRDVYLDNVKKQFWEIMRWDYDFLLSKYQQKSEYINRKIEDLDNNIKSIDQEIKGKENEREEERKKTRNIEEAIAHINQNLLELGIDGFKIEKCDKTKYRLVRNAGESEDIFRSLSEGEKMIISFLYFKEFCEGNERDSSSTDKKIIVIDDPISSLSHIYVFSVGRMIYKYFFKNNKYEQFFVLTHSLYFFYELADRKKERRRKNQKLFRITKDSKGSQVEDMKYEEIQNDYQSYWSVIKDAKQPPALIANCMRNIIEYFFNFTENIALNDLFQKKPLDGIKYQAFSRFINRESHSEGQNIFDLKEFDYNDFKEAFRLVFEQNGYKNHYDKMMK